MPPQKPKPPALAARMALPDAELRETLDLLAKVLASVSDRLDAQGELLQRLAEAQPGPELMATASEKAVRGSLEPLMHRVLDVLSDLTGNKARLRQRLRIGGQWMQVSAGREACVVWREEAGGRQTEVSR